MPFDTFSEDLSLTKFKEKITPEGCQSLPVYAYRMDGKKDPIPPMSAAVKLGGVSICDYLYIQKDKAVLIEDTCLGQKSKRFLNPIKKILKKRILQKILIKWI